MAKITGSDGDVKFNGTTYSVKNWSIDWSIDMLDDTDTGDSGNRSFIAGLTGATGTFDYEWDSGSAPLTPGATNAELDLYLDAANTKYIKIASAYINSTSISSSVDAITTITYSFTATGAVTYETS